MSQEDTSTEVKQKKPVGTQETPVEEKPKPSKEELDKAVKEAMDEMFAVTPAWQPKEVVKFLIECPSGQNVLAKHMDILDLAAADLVEDMDMFSKRLLPSNFDDQGRPVDDPGGSIWKSLSDIKKRHKFLDMTNRLMAVASVRPKIIDDGVAIVKDEDGKDTIKYGYQMGMQEQLEYFEKPIPELAPGQAYAGCVGFPDRMSFFVELQKPMGMIEPFRERQALMLENLEPVQDTGVPTK